MSRTSTAPASFRVDGSAFPIDPVMAMDASAFDRSYPAAFHYSDMGQEDQPRPYAVVRGVAIVDVVGPLAQRAGWYYDGYDEIQARFSMALNDPEVASVMLRIDSPGGSAAGVFEAVASMMRAKEKAKKPVVSYANEMAASAGYALALVGDHIWLPESGMVGSVGVIGVMWEQSEALKKAGVRVTVLTTGANKADGHPAVPITDEAVARYQANIDHMGGLFFALAAKSRGMTVEAVSGLEAGLFQGKRAVDAGLADGVGSFEDFINGIQTSQADAGAPRQEKRMANEIATNAGAVPSLTIITVALAMGLSAESSERDILTRVSALRSTHDELLRVSGRATAEEALGVVQAGLIASAEVPTLRGQIADLRRVESGREVDAMVETAKSLGKITSPDAETELRALGAENPTRLRALLGALPVLVTTSAKATVEPINSAVSLTAEERVIARQLSISEGDFATMKRSRAQEGA